MTAIGPQPPSDSPVGPGQGRVTIFQRFLGLQGKLIFAFSLLLMVALATTSFLFVKKSRDALLDILGEQARQISQTLGLAAETPYKLNDVLELRRLGRDQLRSRNIVLVAFYNPAGKLLSVACRDPDYGLRYWRGTPEFQTNTQRLMQVQHRNLPSLGNFLQITAPVFEVFGRAETRSLDQNPANADVIPEHATRLLGYVTVGVSQNNEQAMLQRVSLLGVGSGCLIFLCCLPLASGLVHRIFLPIRQLVHATNRIAGGDYDAQVATHRPDEIGMLARSFNQMVRRIREHQRQLQVANTSLAEANRDLEEKVHRRTGQLEASNRRLSAEMAEKEDFLRAVSHDLNAPLRNIGGMATLLLMKHRQSFDNEIVHRLERIQKNVEVETDLITELLELSRIKTRRQKMETVDLDAVARDIAGVLEDDLKAKETSLVIDNPLPAAHCEKARMRQVFQNLVDNAIKYMGQGELREIHIGCRPVNDELEFYVRDTGIGIEKEDLPRIFYVFRRGKNSTAMNVAGKGVGLASVKSIIETHNGRIWVESDVGKGSTFRFTIPAKLPGPGDDPSGRDIEDAAATGGELVNAN